MAGNESTFRFALSPWHRKQGGSWQAPQDIVSDTRQHLALIDHAREIIARSRVADELSHWQVGISVSSDNSPEFQRGFDQILSIFERLVTRYDGRPILFLHPDSAPFHEAIKSTSWHGSADNIAIPLIQEKNIWKYEQAIDRSLWDISQQRLTIDRLNHRIEDEGISIYAWMVDEHHRYYQQYLGYMTNEASRKVVHIDWMKPSAWESGSHQIQWHPSVKRRVRQLGLQIIPDKELIHTTDQKIFVSQATDHKFPHQDTEELAFTFTTDMPSDIPAWAKYEYHFQLNQAVDNPYDPEQANIYAEVEAPDGELHTFPAFWFEPMNISLNALQQEIVTPAGTGHWIWRYAFNQPGAWRVRFHAMLKRRNQTIETITDWTTISVSPKRNKQLLPVSKSSDPRYWETSDGAWFYPMGITIRSPGDTRQNELMRQEDSSLKSEDWEALGTHAYAQWFAKLEAHGGNYIRMWMAPWWTALEWNRKWDGYQGLGRYNQANAARIDRILEHAQQHNIYLQLELASHGMTSENVDEQWDPGEKRNTLGSPYNSINGGPVRRAAEFYSDETAWKYHQRRLRYTIARWGWAPHIMSWVLSSEMEFTGAYWQEAMRRRRNAQSPTLSKWIDRNLAWFVTNDLHQRPVSVHFSHPWRAERIWQKDGLGFSYSNAYTGFQGSMGQLGRPQSGLGGALLTYIGRHFRPHNLKRPTLIGEWGGHWQERNSKTLAAEWRTGLWMQAVLPYSGNTGFWWWLWVDASDGWQQMAPVRKFVMDEDPRGRDLKPIIARVRHPRETVQRLRMVAAKGPEHIAAYAYHEGYDFKHYQAAPIPPEDPENWPSVRFETNLPNSVWHCKRYSTETGDVVETFNLTSDAEGRLILSLERVQPDAVFRLSLHTDQAAEP